MLDMFKSFDAQLDSGDVVSNFTKVVVDSDAYVAKISNAFLSTSAKGANYLRVTLELLKNSNDEPVSGEITDNIFFTNREGKFTYTTKANKESLLPGAQLFNDLTSIILGKSLNELNDDDLTTAAVDLWSSQSGKAEPTKVTVIKSLIDSQITVGINKVKRNKYSNGNLTNEVNYENRINKFFDADTKASKTELLTKSNELSAYDNWLKRNKGKEINEYTAIAVSLDDTQSTAVNANLEKLFSK